MLGRLPVIKTFKTWGLESRVMSSQARLWPRANGSTAWIRPVTWRQVICPSGTLCKFVSRTRTKNISLFQKCKSVVWLHRPALTRGALRDRHGCWARDAMDAEALEDEQGHADGEVVWS